MTLNRSGAPFRSLRARHAAAAAWSSAIDNGKRGCGTIALYASALLSHRSAFSRADVKEKLIGPADVRCQTGKGLRAG